MKLAQLIRNHPPLSRPLRDPDASAPIRDPGDADINRILPIRPHQRFGIGVPGQTKGTGTAAPLPRLAVTTPLVLLALHFKGITADDQPIVDRFYLNRLGGAAIQIDGQCITVPDHTALHT